MSPSKFIMKLTTALSAKAGGIVRYAFIGLMTLLSLQATAESKLDFPKQIEIDGQKLSLKGSGYRTATWFKVKVYHAAFYMDDLNGSVEQVSSPRVIDIVFDRNVDASDIKKAWLEAFAKSCPSPCAVDANLIGRFISAASSVKKDEKIRYRFLPKKVEVTAPDGKIATYEDKYLPTVLLSTWIGDHPPTAELKQALLGRP